MTLNSCNLRVLSAACFSLVLIGCATKNAQPLRQIAAKDSTEPEGASRQGPIFLSVQMFTYEQRQGKVLYAKYCAVCHGIEGKGDGFNAYNLDPKPRDFTEVEYMTALSDARLVETISQGGRGVNRSPLMPSWRGRLNNQEVEYVISYIRWFSKTDK